MNTTFNDVKGCDEVKDWFRNCVVWKCFQLKNLQNFSGIFQGPPRTWDSFMVSGTHTIPIEKTFKKKSVGVCCCFLKTARNSLSGAIFGEEV